MFLGRIAAISFMSKRKKGQQKLKKGQKRQRNQTLREHFEICQEKNSRKNKIKYKSYPKAAWFLGLLMLSCGIAIFYLLWHHNHFFYDEIDGISLFWKYVIDLFMVVVGLLFLYFAEIESVHIDRKKNLFYLSCTNSFLQKQQLEMDLDNLQLIKIVKRGYKTMESDTTHYLLQFKFDEKFSFKNYLKELSAEQIEQNEEFRELKNQVDKKLSLNDKMNVNSKDNQLVIQEKNQNKENIAYEDNLQNYQEQDKYDYSEKEDVYYIEVLENNDLGTVKKNYVEVMEFIGRPINFDLWININDETKGDQERKNNFRKNKEKQKQIQNEKRRQKLEELLNKQQKYDTVGLDRNENDGNQKVNGKKKSLSDLYLEQKYSKKYKRSTKKQDIQKKFIQKQDNNSDDLTQISILEDISFQNDQKEDQYQQEKIDIEMSYQHKINKNNKKIKNDCDNNFNQEKFVQDDINFNVQQLEQQKRENQFNTTDIDLNDSMENEVNDILQKSQ